MHVHMHPCVLVYGLVLRRYRSFALIQKTYSGSRLLSNLQCSWRSEKESERGRRRKRQKEKTTKEREMEIDTKQGRADMKEVD